ncbi:MAG: hypothetical protein U0T82_05825 [Bacteroidales bacterium]
MKNKILLLPVLLLAFACSQEELNLQDKQGAMSEALSCKTSGVTITVPPSGGDDTPALLQAFADAKEAGPGTVIQLLEGTYTIGMIEVHDFVGTFTGVGKGKTVITNLTCLPCEAQWEQNQLPALVKFVGGNLKLSKMTYRMQDGEPCTRGPLNDAIYGDIATLLVLADYSSNFVPETRKIIASLNNVEFIAGDDGGYGLFSSPGNVAMMVYCGSDMIFATDFMPLSFGHVTIQNCYFENAMCGPDFWAFDENSSVLVENCVLNECDQQIFMGAMLGSDVRFKNNLFKNGTLVDMYIEAWDWGYYPGIIPSHPTRYEITGNRFQSTAGEVSLFIRDQSRLQDPYGYPAAFAEIKNNLFSTCKGTLNYPNVYGFREGIAGIEALNLRDARIIGNKFFGSGDYGIMLDGDSASGAWAENISCLGNQFFNTNYEVGSIFLGPYSKNCMVAGSGTGIGTFVDLGTNNRISGPLVKKFNNYPRFSSPNKKLDFHMPAHHRN